MSTRLDKAANIAIIVVCLAASAHFLTALARGRTAAPATARPVPAVYQPGDSVTLPGVSFGARQQTLVLVVRKGCRYCTESMPFYSTLLTQVSRPDSGTQLAIVAPDAIDETRAYFAEHGVQPGTSAIVTAPLRGLKIRGTPTLLLVDRQGKVSQAWTGRLNPEQEKEVIAQARPPA